MGNISFKPLHSSNIVQQDIFKPNHMMEYCPAIRKNHCAIAFCSVNKTTYNRIPSQFGGTFPKGKNIKIKVYR